jgi:hypothetical protein
VCVALIIQHAERMRPTVLSSAAYLALQYFSTLSHKRHDFREKFNQHKTRVSILSNTLSQKILIVRRTGRDVIKNAHWSSFQADVINCQILIKITIFFWQNFEKYPYNKFHENPSN